MKLIITEKPDVTKQVKNVLAPNAKYQTIPKSKMGYYENKEFVICNSVGHCIELKAPNEIDEKFNWNLSSLPYNLPQDLPTKISSEKRDVFNTIQHCFLLHDYDEIIIATDGDREGQNIWRKIKLHLKKYKPKKESRMWLSEWTPDGIQTAYKTRFPNSEKENLGIAAQCREEGDWKWGMEGTVAANSLVKTYKKGDVSSVGRVMTAVSKIVVDLEMEILNFKPEKYKSLVLVTATNDKENLELKHVCDKRLSDSESAEILKKIKNHKDVKLNKTVKKTSQKCPMLYDGTTIMQDMNKRYGLSAKQTTDIIQKLYQTYALITYPGTNDTCISEGTAEMAYNAFKNMTSLYGKEIDEIKKNKWKVSKHVVTKKDLAHEAITPVFGKANTANISALTANELNVYKAICERFIAIFYPNVEYEEVKINAELENETFRASGKAMLSPGWTVVLGAPKDNLLPSVTDGENYKIVELKSEDKVTTPPTRFTEDTLIEAMKNAGRYVEDSKQKEILKDVKGLGTSRTRASIIENLKRRGYFVLKKKTILPTEKAIKLLEVLPKSSITSPAMTAHFEEMLNEVEEGRMTKKEYMKQLDAELNDFIHKIQTSSTTIVLNEAATKTTASKSSASTSFTEEKKSSPNDTNLTCPYCGKTIRKGQTKTGVDRYYCEDWNDCGFQIYGTMLGKKLSTSNIKQLCTKKQTSVIKGFTSSKGAKFDARLQLDNQKKINFVFENSKK